MKKHTKVYLLSRCGEIPAHPINCELHELNDGWADVVDIHHIGGRGAGGSKLLDRIEKLMGLCRACHLDCENNVYTEEQQLQLHEEFLINNNIPYDVGLLYASRHELLNNYKNGI